MLDVEHIQPVTQSSFIKIKQGSGDRLGCCGESRHRSLAFLSDKNNIYYTSMFFLFIFGDKEMYFFLHNSSSHTHTTLTVYKSNVM